jgi:hypothetical protein
MPKDGAGVATADHQDVPVGICSFLQLVQSPACQNSWLIHSNTDPMFKKIISTMYVFSNQNIKAAADFTVIRPFDNNHLISRMEEFCTD